MRPDLHGPDGSLWEAHHKDHVFATRALRDSTAPQFFLREIKRNPARKWWCRWRPEFVLTGRTWAGSSLFDGGFSVIQREG